MLTSLRMVSAEAILRDFDSFLEISSELRWEAELDESEGIDGREAESGYARGEDGALLATFSRINLNLRRKPKNIESMTGKRP
jgi:hypothetical protein